PVQREQRDQRVLERWAEPSGDQERAELVAVRGDSMGLVIQPRTADVRGRRIIEQLFFDRVLVEPAMVHNRRMTVAGPAPGFEFPGEAFDVGAGTPNSGRERVRHQVVNWRRSRAYASLVKPRYPARNRRG